MTQTAHDLSDLTREDLAASAFEPHVGEAFTLWAAGVPVPLVLDAVSRVAGSDDSFALAFHAAAALGQGTYPVEHATVGRMVLFLVPVGHDASGALVEAVFNRSPRPARP